MKKLLIPLLLWCFGCAIAETPIILSEVNTSYEEVYVPLTAQCVTLPTNFGEAVILSKEEIELLGKYEIYRIDLVYTRFRTSPDFDQVALNKNRIKALEMILPQIHRDNPEWKLIEQTGATKREEAAMLFHGFKIYYRIPTFDYSKQREFFGVYGQHKTIFTIDPGKDNTLDYESGTTIYIPADAIVDKRGQKVTGEVEIIYVEYRNAADIALSGIPMKYKSEEEDMNYSFTSKGMYEIRGYQNASELYLQKDITIDFNATASTENTGFFKLNEETGDWNKIRDLEKMSVKKVEPAMINVKNDVEDVTVPIEVQFPLNFDVNADMSHLAKNTAIHTWTKPGKYGRYKLVTKILSADTAKIEFNKNAWKHFCEESTENKYDTLNWRPEIKSKTVIIPLKQAKNFTNLFMLGRTFDDLNLNWNMGFETAKNDIAATLLAEGADKGHTYPNLVKGLNSKEFGVYNCDQVYRMGKPMALIPTYLINGEPIENGDVACVMDLNYNGSFSFAPESITLNKEGKNALLLFTKDQKILIAMPGKMADLDYSRASVEIPMQDITDKMKTSDDLKELLNI